MWLFALHSSVAVSHCLRRGCEAWVVREGYEGLVRGNSVDGHDEAAAPAANSESESEIEFMQNLRFGDGNLLKDGTSDNKAGRTLRGRYIVRVGWDDVRGWCSEASPG